MHRRTVLLGAGALGLGFVPSLVAPAFAANAAEDFIGGNIQAGFDILNDRNASPSDRRERFATFLWASPM